MALSCSICFGKLVNPPDHDDDFRGNCRVDPSEVEISAGKCGHFFHDFCIRGWLNHLRSQGSPKECPSCRTSIGRLKKLYPTFCNVSRAPSIVPDVVAPAPATPTAVAQNAQALDFVDTLSEKKKELNCFQKHFLFCGFIVVWMALFVLGRYSCVG